METRIPAHSKRFMKCVIIFKKNIKKYSYLYCVLQRAKNTLQYMQWRFRVFHRKKKNSFNFDTIYWVNPQEIKLCTLKEFNPFLYDGVLLGGDWDVSQKVFNNLDVFIAFTQHFKSGVTWEKTDFFRNIINDIKNNNEYYWNCQNETEFLERCKSMDKLYKQIKENGYCEQTKLSERRFNINRIDEISVNVSRNGTLLFNNGAHRLSIAKILNLEAIPVRVTVTHKNCTNFSSLAK